MHQKAKVLAVIPARGGSKGLPGKNIRELCGLPLIGYSIRVALSARNIDRVIVSTDSEEIAAVARSLGAEVPFLRPPSLAGDASLISEAVFYVLDALREESYHPDAVVELYPTHPFRTVPLVDELAVKLCEGYSPVNTVRRIVHDPLSVMLRRADGTVFPVQKTSEAPEEARRHYYRKYGLFAGRNRTSVDNPYFKVVNDPVSLIDIDTLSDFRLAEHVIGNGLFDFQLDPEVS
ncbi:acylneuraminate cytidylyltransferase family protein [Desulfovibrio subterraneus]|uniref:acylneuraminate cytidylyltransferase family protein n=1 Tax=Desulfovibrio subterraneus TaxID=2718620 RepID=UPI0022B91328|nr:acylneuraminate cytidylyltransferase family protein [Desulfovibrio subterraneus]WBF66810.1 acylneuraminate cytidylyltransferase family protein [Desulfovibrio subterraneus]